MPRSLLALLASVKQRPLKHVTISRQHASGSGGDLLEAQFLLHPQQPLLERLSYLQLDFLKLAHGTCNYRFITSLVASTRLAQSIVNHPCHHDFLHFFLVIFELPYHWYSRIALAQSRPDARV